MEKKYWHELTKEEIDKLIEEKQNYQFVRDNYKQPDWCSYPDALNALFGCWSLMDLSGNRIKISHDFCKTCDCYKP